MLEAALYEGLRRPDIADRIRRLLAATAGPPGGAQGPR